VPSSVADEIFAVMRLGHMNPPIDSRVYVPCRLSGDERAKVLDIIGREVARAVAAVDAAGRVGGYPLPRNDGAGYTVDDARQNPDTDAWLSGEHEGDP